MRDFHSFVAYVATFVRYAMVIRTVIVVNLLWIVASGVAVAKFEGLKLGDGIYFAFVTALSVGYGDIAPRWDVWSVSTWGSSACCSSASLSPSPHGR